MCITFKALDNDVNCFLGRDLCKNIRDAVGWVELCWRIKRAQENGVVLFCSNDRVTDAREGEGLGHNVVKVRALSDFDRVLEMIHCLRRVDLDRKRVGGCLSINKAEQGQLVVGHCAM